MQYLDNDMDELFNKAGSDYPLRTDVPDFNGVLGKLNPAVDQAPKRDYRKYLLLLLLLPVGYLFNNRLDKREVTNVPVTELNHPAVSSDVKAPRAPFSKEAEQAHEPADKSNSAKQFVNGKEQLDFSLRNLTTPGLHRFGKPAQSTISLSPMAKLNTQQEERGRTGTSSDIFSNNNISSNRNGHLTAPRVNYSYEKPIISFPELPIDSSSPNPVKESKHKSSIYIGVIAGPDISTVKYQSIKNIGFSVGILGGYKFSKHWSVEAGLIYNSKKYYTDGKYFDKTKSGIPPSIYVESLDGSCNMFEVPLAVRYDFSTNKNKFFATLGVTSYFMKKEKYTYDAYAAGIYYEGHRSYDNSGNHPFSNMQLSIGYNRQLSNKINLRIEPYIKVPIRDIGIGNLPITSSGIYFSVMQSIR